MFVQHPPIAANRFRIRELASLSRSHSLSDSNSDKTQSSIEKLHFCVRAELKERETGHMANVNRSVVPALTLRSRVLSVHHSMNTDAWRGRRDQSGRKWKKRESRRERGKTLGSLNAVLPTNAKETREKRERENISEMTERATVFIPTCRCSQILTQTTRSSIRCQTQTRCSTRRKSTGSALRGRGENDWSAENHVAQTGKSPVRKRFEHRKCAYAT